MAYETLLYETSGEIATITLNRPARMNAYTAEMGLEIADAMLRADADPEARVIIMTGAGNRAFCAGADMAMFASNIKSREDSKSETPAAGGGHRRSLSLPMIMRGLKKPTIAAINGYALGVGCTIPLLFDVRVASDNAKMGVIFPRVGLMSELGSSYLMPRLIGLARTAEMMLTGRQYTAEQCLAMGLVSQVYPAAELMPKARELAGEMLDCSPMSLALTRKA
ncbi:MAG: enoyl-CoA hydratase/isomerase family protein, partial [Pseudomonadota bacterium]